MIKYENIANKILHNHNGNIVVLLYPTPKGRVMFSSLSNIMLGFI
jgi:hypothetical protein